jgi:hypothetical protein
LKTRWRVLRWSSCALSTRIRTWNYSPRKQLPTWHTWTTFDIIVKSKLPSTNLLISVRSHLDVHRTFNTSVELWRSRKEVLSESPFKAHAAGTGGRRK